MNLPDEMTYGESYGPPMQIVDQAEADAYFRALVERNIRLTGNSDAEAERIERVNLGYWAGYYDAETAQRVERLYGAAHPIFGSTRPIPERAIDAGAAMAALTQAIGGAAVDFEALGGPGSVPRH